MFYFKDNDSIVKQYFPFVKGSGFYSNFMNTIEQNNPSTLDPDCLGIDKIRRYANTDRKEKYNYIFLATQPWTFKEIIIL